jgi:hypothetical protein
VFFSLVLGLIFRTSYSSENLTELIQRKLAETPSPFSVSFERAEISLADGALPDLALVIRNIRLSSTNECWGQPSLEANELRLPLSIRDLARGHLQFRTANLDAIELTFFSNKKTCNEPTPEVANPVGKGSPPNINDRPKEALLDRIKLGDSEVNVSIRNLVVRLPDENQTALTFEKCTLSPDGRGNNSFEGTLKLSKENFLRDATSRALVKVEYLSKPMIMNFSIDGNWREGLYAMSGFYNLKNPEWSYSGQLQNVPLTAAFPVAQKYKLLQRDFGPGEMWLSGDFRTPTPEEKKRGIQLELSNMKLGGDLGELSLEQLELRSLNPPAFEPTNIQIQGLRVDAVLDFLKVENRSPMIGKWGIFNGKVHIGSLEDLHLEGEHSGMELIFANRGQRQNQVVSLMVGKADLVQDRWVFRLDSVKPLDGIFLGQASIQYLPENEVMTAELQIDEMTLSPEVQKLMTDGGTLGRWSGALSLSTRKGQLSQATGEVDGNDLLIEGVLIDRIKAILRSRSGGLVLDLKAADVEIQEGLVANWLVRFAPGSPPQKISTLSSRMDFQPDSKFKWKLGPMALPQGTLDSEGIWDASGAVTGNLNFDPKAGPKKTWSISGSRENPEFNPL